MLQASIDLWCGGQVTAVTHSLLSASTQYLLIDLVQSFCYSMPNYAIFVSAVFLVLSAGHVSMSLVTGHEVFIFLAKGSHQPLFLYQDCVKSAEPSFLYVLASSLVEAQLQSFWNAFI